MEADVNAYLEEQVAEIKDRTEPIELVLIEMCALPGSRALERVGIEDRGILLLQTQYSSLSQRCLVREGHPTCRETVFSLEGLDRVQIHDWPRISKWNSAGYKTEKKNSRHMRGMRCQSIFRLERTNFVP